MENVAVPKEWTFSKEEEEFLQKLQIENCESLSIAHHFWKWMQEWLEQKKYRITSSNADKVLIRQKSFETLTENLFVKKNIT